MAGRQQTEQELCCGQWHFGSGHMVGVKSKQVANQCGRSGLLGRKWEWLDNFEVVAGQSRESSWSAREVGMECPVRG